MPDKSSEPDETEYGLMQCTTSGWKECQVVQDFRVTGAKIVILLEDCCPDHRKDRRILVPSNMYRSQLVKDKRYQDIACRKKDK